MGTEFNPNMLTLGRELRGLTQKQLALNASIDQGLISRYENGVRAIVDNDLYKIAKALDLPEEFFYRSGQINGPETTSIYHRKRQSVSVSQLNKIYARLNLVRMDVQRLLNSVDVESPYPFPKYNLAEYDNNIDLIASHVRAAWRIPAGPVPNVVTVIENAGGVVAVQDFGTIQVDAVVQWIPPLPPIFLVNSGVPGDRLRFTLAHEIGHIILHTQPKLDMEEEADAFASAFLMPAKEISVDLASVSLPHLAQLKPKWRVSIQALIRRAFDLKKVTERQYRSLMTEMTKAGYRRAEPFQIPLEQPTLIRELIEVHKTDYDYNEDEFSKLFTAYAKEWRSIYLNEKTPPKPALRVIRNPRKDDDQDEEATGS